MTQRKRAAAAAAALLIGITGTIAYQQLRAPGGKARQVRVDPARGSATPSTATAGGDATSRPANPAWRERFDAVYLLTDGETLKRIPPPFIPERADFNRSQGFHCLDEKYPDRNAVIFVQDARGVKRDYSIIGGAYSVKSLFSDIVKVSPQQVELPLAVMKLEPPGDWVYRAASTTDQRMAALAQALASITGKPLELVRAPREREVVVVSGKFKYQPLPGMRERAKGERTIHLFLGKPNLDDPEGVGGGGGLRHALEEVSDVSGYGIVYETGVDNVAGVRWRQHDSFLVEEETRGEKPMPEEKMDELLGNLAKQTSLDLKRERRTVEMWVMKSTAL